MKFNLILSNSCVVSIKADEYTLSKNLATWDKMKKHNFKYLFVDEIILNTNLIKIILFVKNRNDEQPYSSEFRWPGITVFNHLERAILNSDDCSVKDYILKYIIQIK